MSIELLDTELVTRKIRENGWTRKWVIRQLNLGQDGYKLLRGDWLPKNRDRKSRLLRKLAEILGVEVGDLLLRFEAKRTA